MKKQVTLRVDADVLDWFRSSGKGYQSRMNEVLCDRYRKSDAWWEKYVKGVGESPGLSASSKELARTGDYPEFFIQDLKK